MRSFTYLIMYAALVSAIVFGVEAKEEFYFQECNEECETRRVNTFRGEDVRVDEYEKNHMGVNRPTGRKLLKSSFRMRRSEYVPGTCFVDINEDYIYYKITGVTGDLVWVAQEDEDQPFWLIHRHIFYQFNKGFKTHQKIDCSNTPRLGISGYVEDCVKNRRRVGNFACDDRNINFQ